MVLLAGIVSTPVRSREAALGLGELTTCMLAVGCTDKVIADEGNFWSPSSLSSPVRQHPSTRFSSRSSTEADEEDRAEKGDPASRCDASAATKVLASPVQSHNCESGAWRYISSH